MHPVQLRRGHLVEILVAPRLRDGGLVEIDAGRVRRAAEHRGRERKAAGVAAEVEHARILHQPGEPPAVVALVAEEAGFVALGKVDLVAHAVLANPHLGRRRGRHFLHQRRLDALEAAQVVVDVRHACASCRRVRAAAAAISGGAGKCRGW